MERNPSNTSIFLFAIYPNVLDPIYRDNLLATVRAIQDCGFEPYVVSQHPELLEDANLFVDVKGKMPFLETKPFWKEHNFLLLDTAVYDKDDICDLLKQAISPCLIKFDDGFLGFYFQDPTKDWLSWARDASKGSIPQEGCNYAILHKTTALRTK